MRSAGIGSLMHVDSTCALGMLKVNMQARASAGLRLKASGLDLDDPSIARAMGHGCLDGFLAEASNRPSP